VAAAAATRGREGVAAIGLLGRNEGERRYIKGLRFYLTTASRWTMQKQQNPTVK